MKNTLPELGSVVGYVRVDSEKAIHVGSAVVRSIFLSPDDRLMVQVKDREDNAFNVDLVCINPSRGLVKKYEDMMVEVSRISSESNDAIKDMVEGFNETIDDIYNNTIGNPIKIEAL